MQGTVPHIRWLVIHTQTMMFGPCVTHRHRDGWKPYHPSFEATVAKLKNNNLGLAISFYYRITVIKPQWYPIKAVQ